MVKITDVMTPDPVTVRPDSTLEDTVRLIAKHRIDVVPVVNPAHHPVGLVTTETLFLQRRSFGISYEKQYTLFGEIVDPEDLWEAYEENRSLPVSQIMTKNIVTVDTKATLRQVAQTMAIQELPCVLVTDNDCLVGIITRIDLILRLMKISS